MKKIKQFRYYGDGSPRNYPNDASTKITLGSLKSGSIFGNYYPILQLGIQAPPGTKFYLNGAINPVVIGATGIYELELKGITEITSLYFDYDGLNTINNKYNNQYLLIDIIYDDRK